MRFVVMSRRWNENAKRIEWFAIGMFDSAANAVLFANAYSDSMHATAKIIDTSFACDKLFEKGE